MTSLYGFAPWRERARSLAARGAARLIFVLESLAIAACLLLILSFFIVRSDWLDATREWGSFLTHYALASSSSRAPVNAFLLGVLGLTTAMVAILRAPWAVRFWRALDAYYDARAYHGARPARGQFQNGGMTHD